MPEPTRPLIEALQDEIKALGRQVGESVELRWRLAVLELQSDRRAAARLAAAWATAAVLGLSGLPVLVVWLAGRASEWSGAPESAWLVGFGVSLLISAVLTGWLAWRRFRRRFLGLEQTLEELREDALWLREWTRR